MVEVEPPQLPEVVEVEPPQLPKMAEVELPQLPEVAQEMLMFVRSFGSNLSRAFNFHLSSSDLQAINQKSTSSQSAVSHQKSISFRVTPVGALNT